eukprot:Nitzschia sp. Nitz4//scaffold1_size375055//299//1195//NITZ4_000199-RA/size375055-augustus-gene-0.701-mRNA-1//-1//CDS//3329540814//6024//frame0
MNRFYGRWLVFLGFALFATCTTSVQGAPKGSKVATQKTTSSRSGKSSRTLDPRPIELTSKSFSSKVSDGNVWLVELYTPWCPFCQEFAASYNNIAEIFHLSPEEGVRVARVNIQEELALKTRFGVTSIPCFFLIDGWSVYEFEEKISEVNLLNFVRGGYKQEEALPLFVSPMGPMGMLQGLFVSSGYLVADLFLFLPHSYGVSPVVAGMLLSASTVVAGMVSIVIFAIVTTPIMMKHR